MTELARAFDDWFRAARRDQAERLCHEERTRRRLEAMDVPNEQRKSSALQEARDERDRYRAALFHLLKALQLGVDEAEVLAGLGKAGQPPRANAAAHS